MSSEGRCPSGAMLGDELRGISLALGGLVAPGELGKCSGGPGAVCEMATRESQPAPRAAEKNAWLTFCRAPLENMPPSGPFGQGRPSASSVGSADADGSVHRLLNSDQSHPNRKKTVF